MLLKELVSLQEVLVFELMLQQLGHFNATLIYYYTMIR